MTTTNPSEKPRPRAVEFALLPLDMGCDAAAHESLNSWIEKFGRTHLITASGLSWSEDGHPFFWICGQTPEFQSEQAALVRRRDKMTFDSLSNEEKEEIALHQMRAAALASGRGIAQAPAGFDKHIPAPSPRVVR